MRNGFKWTPPFGCHRQFTGPVHTQALEIYAASVKTTELTKRGPAHSRQSNFLSRGHQFVWALRLPTLVASACQLACPRIHGDQWQRPDPSTAQPRTSAYVTTTHANGPVHLQNLSATRVPLARHHCLITSSFHDQCGVYDVGLTCRYKK